MERIAMPKLITVCELSKHFSVHPETVRLWVRTGRVPCIRPTARTIRFDLKAVEKALAKSLRPNKGDVAD